MFSCSLVEKSFHEGELLIPFNGLVTMTFKPNTDRQQKQK